MAASFETRGHARLRKVRLLLSDMANKSDTSREKEDGAFLSAIVDFSAELYVE